MEVVEIKNIRQGLISGGRREVIERRLFSGTSKEVKFNKWL
jgi:hypothetical protein